MRRVSAVVLCAVLIVLGVARPALAHTELVGSDPVEGASVPVAPHQLQLTFNRPIQAKLSAVTVTGPDGVMWTVGQPAVDAVANTVLTVSVEPAGSAGRYAIGYRVVSADGHPVSGTVRFTLTNPVSATAPSAPTQPGTSTQAPQATAADNSADSGDDGGDDGGGMPFWPWVVGAVVLVGIGLVLALRIGRSTSA